MNWIILPLIIFFTGLSSQDSELRNKVWQRKTIEDFESRDFTNKNLRIRGNPSAIPEIRMSRNLLAPVPNTRKSLLLRFPPNTTDLPVEILYDDPISILDFVDEFEFNVYSNDSGGRFSFYLTDAEATQRKIFIGNLNYRGWKKFRVRMSGKVEQNDLVLNKPSPLQFVGFLYEPGRKIRKDREELICIDDVFAITRQKYHIIKNLDKLIE